MSVIEETGWAHEKLGKEHRKERYREQVRLIEQ